MPSADVSLTAIYSAAPIGAFSPVTPYRLIDTRNDAERPPGASSPLPAGTELPVDLSTQPGIPPNASGVLINVTATNPAAAGYVRAYPCGTDPYVSTVNVDVGQTAANLAMVKLPADDRVCFLSSVPTDLVVDVGGWYSPAGQGIGSRYTPVDPVRVLDTRDPTLAPGGRSRRAAGRPGVALPSTGHAR